MAHAVVGPTARSLIRARPVMRNHVTPPSGLSHSALAFNGLPGTSKSHSSPSCVARSRSSELAAPSLGEGTRDHDAAAVGGGGERLRTSDAVRTRTEHPASLRVAKAMSAGMPCTGRSATFAATGTRVVAVSPGARVVMVGGTRTGGSGCRVVRRARGSALVVVDAVVAVDGGAADCAGVSLPPQPARSATVDRTAQRILGDRRRNLIVSFDDAAVTFLPRQSSKLRASATARPHRLRPSRISPLAMNSRTRSRETHSTRDASLRSVGSPTWVAPSARKM